MATAGRVAMIPKGDYNASTAYQMLDVVRYNNKTYIAKKATTGNLPTDTTYWMLSTENIVDTELSNTSGNAVSNKAVKDALDNIQTTSICTLSQAGWYRVAEYDGSRESHFKGYCSNGCILIIKKCRQNGEGEIRTILLESVENEQTFYSIGKGAHHLFTKCRYTYDTEKAYLEVYYNGYSTINDTSFTVMCGEDIFFAWKAITPTLTSETVDGVTVTCTYDIPANASPVTTVDTSGMVFLTALPTGITNNSTMQELINAMPKYSMLSIERAMSPLAPESYSELTVIKTTSAYVIAFAKSQYTKNIYIGGVNTGETWDGWNKYATTADLANYLPLSGGRISSANGSPIELKNTTGGYCGINMYGNSGYLGSFAFSAHHVPAIYDSNGNATEILHTGNSAKVAIQSSAPSDTSALWVDTANKVIKAYIDGAWTQVS